MPSNPAISILIPVYNGGEYLIKTLDNILESTFGNFEIVCVEDFSKDNSLEILQKYSQKDSRIKVVVRDKKGGTAVKGIKYGLPHCNGDYFLFMSQDDLIAKDTLEILYNKAIETNADAVVPDMLWYYEENNGEEKWILPPNNDYSQELTGEEAFKLALNWDIHGFYLRKMDLLKKIGYDDTYLTGCEYVSRVFLYYSNKVVFVKTPFYYRQDNSSAITKKFKPQIIEDVIIYVELLNFMKDNKLEKKFINYWYKKTFGLLVFYRKTLKANYADFNEEERRQSLRILRLSGKKLLKFTVRIGMFHYIPQVIKNSRFREKGYLKKDASVFTPLPFKGNCIVGRQTYSGDGCVVTNPQTVIGSFSSLAGNVTIGPGEHPLNYLSTSPYFYQEALGWREGASEVYAQPCLIGNDVWIGSNVFIKAGVTIGDGAVVGAGAVVTKDVEPYSVVVGVPANILKYRFDKSTIKDLLDLKWWELPDETIKTLPFNDIQKCIKTLKEIRKKGD